MTCIIRKENILLTDSLIFNGNSSGASLEYINKIKLNRAKTMAIVYVGTNFDGSINEALNNLSNLIINKENNNEQILIQDVDQKIIDHLSLDNLDFQVVFFSKKFTYTLKKYSTQICLLTTKYDEYYFAGSASEFISYKNIENISPYELIHNIINTVPSCNGDINMFDLNNLKDIF